MANGKLNEEHPTPLYQMLIEEYEKLHDPLPSNYQQQIEKNIRLLKDSIKKLHSLSPNDPQKIKTEIEKNAQIKTIYESIYECIHKLPQKRTALCLSGGGVRSATFNLGVLQGLAKHGLLDKFHYLSTVSGGGYIAAWLEAWIYHAQKVEQQKKSIGPVALDAGVRKVTEDLKDWSQSNLEPEPHPLRHLREHSNAMTPRAGLLSVDTWTAIATYLRNLLLNWLVLVPLLAAVLMLPRF